MKKVPRLPKGAWFYRVRGSYLPATWQAWLLYIPFVTFLVWSLGYVYDTQSSVADGLLLLFPAWVAAAVVMTWIASKKS